MRILRLRIYCFPEIVASSAMADDIDAAFASNGIVSINFVPVPSRGVSDEIREKYSKIKYEEFKDGHIIIHRFPMFREGKNAFRKMLRYLFCAIIEYFKGVKVRDIDLLFGSSSPFQGLVHAKLARSLSRKYGRKVPFVYCVQDIFPDSLVSAGLTRKGSVIWNIGRKMENYTYRGADRIIVISEDFKKNLMAKGVPEEKIVIIPNWADTEGIYPVDRKDNVLFAQYGLDPDKFYFCYVGNIGRAQNLDLLLDAAKRVKDELPDVRFVLIGDGAAKGAVEMRIKDEAIDNVILLPFLPYKYMAQAFSFGNVGIVCCKPGVGGTAVPSKTWNIMAAERPILASFDKGSSLASLIERVGFGVVADAGSEDQLVQAIRDMRSDSKLAEKGKLGKKYLVTELDKNKCVNKYIDVIKSVYTSTL